MTLKTGQLEEKDKILEYYRTQVDELLDNKLNPDLGDPLNKEEMDEIWEEISTGMDVDNIWDDISSELDIAMPSGSDSGIFIKSIAALIIILFGMIPVKKGIPDSGIIKPDLSIENRQSEQSAQVIIEKGSKDFKQGEKVKENISQALIISSDRGEEDQKIARTEGQRNDRIQVDQLIVNIEAFSIVIADSVMADSNLVISKDYFSTEESDIIPALIPADLGNLRVSSTTDYDIRKTGDNSCAARSSDRLIDRGRISAGLITSFKNTWLLNHETFDGFKSESLNTTEIVFYPDAGVSLNYALNKSWSLQADAFLYSNTGQEYYEYIYGLYSRKKITLTYSTVALSVKYNFTRRSDFMGRSSINLLAGGYLSVLHHADQKINTNLEYIGSQYRKFDLGAGLGWEIELHISDHLSLAPGFFMTLGIPNIYKGDGNIPGYLRRTRNGSEGIRFAIYYH